MLQSLYAKNLALISEIEVEFKEGLNILTGETGAGKSIILGSVSLALGARYTKEILRAGADYGLVELSFYLEAPEIKEQLKKLDIFTEDNIIVLSRKLMDGRSVSKINGETVQMGLLKEVASLLIDIHGQHEHQSLLHKSNHLKILDLFIGDECRLLKESVKEKHNQYIKEKSELEKLSSNRTDKERELSFLEFEIDEINNANLKQGEDFELEKKYRTMQNSKTILENMQRAYLYTDEGNENCASLLSAAIKSVGDSMKYDERLTDIHNQLVDVDALLNDVNRDISTYMSGMEFSDEDFEETEERLNLINKLKSKYGDSIESILEYRDNKDAEVHKIRNLDEILKELSDNLIKIKSSLNSQADKLSKLRKTNAKVLESEIKKGIADLNFGDTRFEINFSKKEEVTDTGIDDVEFLISLNQGEELKSLVNVASGGELSRIMLAIKTVMAKKDEIPTLIFDEIDVGIGGRTAQKVSEKMAIIARTHQVLCITHLPQITAMADAHYLIEKTVKDKKTITGIRELDRAESVHEIARMSGGAEITDSIMDSAKEMKDLADLTKSRI